jgi:polysaccharide biosynthesis transport protein
MPPTNPSPVPDDHLVSLLRPTSWEAEPYRTLRHVLERIGSSRGSALGSVIAVSSSAPGDGKTTTTLNLAAALAEAQDPRVLVIDADLRRGALAHSLGLGGDAGPGLIGAIREDSLGLVDVARPFQQRGFAVVPAGPCPATPYDVLASPRLGALLEEARRQFSFVVLDTPPFIPSTDCRILSRWVDGFLLVVAAHRTPRRLVEETLNVMEPAKLLGLIFNRDDGVLWGSNRYYRYYQDQSLSDSGHRPLAAARGSESDPAIATARFAPTDS